MEGVQGQFLPPGTIRTMQVQIGHSGRFVPPPADQVVPLLQNIEEYTNASSELDPLVRSFIVHYQFEAIHPFSDGNGRVGRLLLSLMIYKWLGHSKPWLYMSPYFEKYKDEYISSLFNVSTKGEWDEWIAFCLKGATIQARDSINRCQLLNNLKANYFDRVKDHSPRTHRIIEGLFREPMLNVTSMRTKFGVTYKTAKTDIEKLLASGVLKEVEGFYPKSFYAPEIVRIAYDETPLIEQSVAAPNSQGPSQPQSPPTE